MSATLIKDYEIIGGHFKQGVLLWLHISNLSVFSEQ